MRIIFIKEIRKLIKALKTNRKRILKQFSKYFLVAGLGTIINLTILYTLTKHAGFNYLISEVFAFFAAVTSNFFLNKTWTFNEKIKKNIFRKYEKFLFVGIFALSINLIFLYLFTNFFGIYYLASQVLATSGSFLFNFSGNKFWTFSKANTNKNI